MNHALREYINGQPADNTAFICRIQNLPGSSPEVSVPAGYGADGMPALNPSIVGLPGEDARVLAWAHAFERQAPRFEAPPRPV